MEVKETEPFIVVPLFEEPMKLAIYESHPWHDRDTIEMSELQVKLLMC